MRSINRFKKSLFLLGLAMTFLAPAAVWGQGGAAGLPEESLPLGYLSWWIGKYPSDGAASDRPAVRGRTFFEDPNIQPALKALMPPAALKVMLRGWKAGRVETPVEGEGDIIKASFCKPHACPDENAAVFVDMRTGKVEVCWHDSGAQGASPRSIWYSPGTAPSAMDQGEDCFGGEGMGLLRKYGGK